MTMPGRDFPLPSEAPPELRDLDGSCGLLAAWQVLWFFDRVPAPGELCRVSRFDPAVGTFAIGLAVALRHLGLSVDFFSDVDPDPTPVERDLYREAAARGVVPRPALDLPTLGKRLADGAVAIALYEAQDGARYGHFTPVLAVAGPDVVAPNEGGLDAADFEARRQRPGIFRQCVIASAPRAA